jgi:hypothetical protein
MQPEKSQSDKFKDLARELEADEDEARWDERLRKIATRNPHADELTPEDGPSTKR